MNRPLLIIQHAPAEGPGRLATLWEAAGYQGQIIRQYAQDRWPESVGAYAGLIVLGGPMGVADAKRLPWLAAELDSIQEALSRQVPVLGICLGAQLLAAALGAPVYRGAKLEIGWHAVRLTAEGQSDPLLGRLPESLMVFHWHGDTFDLPRGATLLASSKLYPHQAFRHQDSYGLQFHLEAGSEMIESWARANQPEFGAAGLEMALLSAQSRRYAPELDRQAQGLFSELFRRWRAARSRSVA